MIQANENELKLTRSDAEEKARIVEELRNQLKEVNQQINSIHKAQEMNKGSTFATLKTKLICIFL